MAQPAPYARTVVVQPAPLPTVWQPAELPAKVRGVSADPVPTKFVLPSPEALGVATTVSVPQAAPVDWRQIQARMERLGVLRYQKIPVPKGGCQVTLLLPTVDPARSQPVEAQGETEAAAVLLALQTAKRRGHGVNPGEVAATRIIS